MTYDIDWSVRGGQPTRLIVTDLDVQGTPNIPGLGGGPHDHDAEYAPLHNHPYAGDTHNHDGVYATTGHTHPGGVTIARKTGDQANSTLTPADVTDLLLPIAALQSLSFEFTVYFIAAASTTGIVLSCSGPASPTHVRIAFVIPTSTTAQLNTAVSAFGSEVIGTGSATATPLGAKVYGHVVNGNNAGNVQLRFRSEVNASAVTIQRGSHGWAA